MKPEEAIEIRVKDEPLLVICLSPKKGDYRAAAVEAMSMDGPIRKMALGTEFRFGGQRWRLVSRSKDPLDGDFDNGVFRFLCLGS